MAATIRVDVVGAEESIFTGRAELWLFPVRPANSASIRDIRR